MLCAWRMDDRHSRLRTWGGLHGKHWPRGAEVSGRVQREAMAVMAARDDGMLHLVDMPGVNAIVVSS